MPITPRFDISQTSDDVIVTIHVPNIRVSDDTVEVLLEEQECILHFYASPYLLKLNFSDKERRFRPGISEDGSLAGKFDPAKSTITIALPKDVPGEYWSQLDLVARLLQPKHRSTTNPRWLQEVLNQGGSGVSIEVANGNADAKNDDNDETMHAPTDTTSSSNQPEQTMIPKDRRTYGFANMFHSIFSDFAREGIAQEMLQAPNPDDAALSQSERYQLRIDREWDDFDPERYVGDLELSSDRASSNDLHPGDYVHQLAMSMKPHWQQHQKQEQPELAAGSHATATAVAEAKSKVDEDEVDSNGMTDGSAQFEDEDKEQDGLASAVAKLSLDNKQQDNKPNPRTLMHPPTAYFTDDERLLLSTVPYPLLPDSVFATSSPDTGSHSNNNTSSMSMSISDAGESDNDASAQMATLWCGLIDILAAYVYDHLITQGDPTVESAWTISTLSSTLSWLEDNTDVGHVVLTSLRRQLIYPYIRSFDFSIHVWEQVLRILTSGRYAILRSLLQCRRILQKSEFYYLGNKLFVDPYLAWIQRIGDVEQSLLPFIHEIQHLIRQPTLKEGVGLDLIRYERMVMGDNDDDDNSGDSSDDSASGTDESDEDGDDADDGEGDDTNADDQRQGAAMQDESVPSQAILAPPSAISSVLLDDMIQQGNHGGGILNIVATQNHEVPSNSLVSDNLIAEDDGNSGAETKQVKSSLITEI